MNRNKLKTYAPQARREFIEAVTARAALFGLTAKKIEPMTEQGDVVLVVGRAFPKAVGQKRKKLEARIQRQGFDQTMEAMAYTWFNRLVAIRFMELHGYLDHGYRVLSSLPVGEGQAESGVPEIVEHAEHVDLPGLNKQKVIELKLDGTKEDELYRLLLVAQCNALNEAMPFLFEPIDDETELLVPDHLLHSDSLIRKLVEDIPEEDWQEVEIIGWLYQFYISEKKDEVIGKVVKSEDIPAATQLFTPNWIVKYLVQNSLGRQWMATYPNLPLKARMEYYIEPAEQTPEVQAKLAEITPKSLNPEELTLLDPACGSGHILVEAYDLLKSIYQERGYRAKDIPRLILEKNLFGLEIDDRAAQLSAFALMMKARADDRNIFDSEAQPNIVAFEDSQGMNAADITHALNSPINKEEMPTEYLFEEIEDAETPLFSKKAMAEKGHVSQGDIAALLALFENAKTFGSLIQVPPKLTAKLPEIEQRLNDVLKHGDLTHAPAHVIMPLLRQARFLARQYDTVVANPPYMGSKSLPAALRDFAKETFPEGKSDLFAVFVERISTFTSTNSYIGVMTPFTWMFISSYEAYRRWLLEHHSICSLIQPEYHAFFDSAYVPICASVMRKCAVPSAGTFINLSDFYGEELQPLKAREAIQDRSCGWLYTVRQNEFDLIPGSPIAYSASNRVRMLFAENPPISSICSAQKGLATCHNERFVRFWWEVDIARIGRNVSDCEESVASQCRWFPFNKGGEFRRWYGNLLHVVNWESDGKEIKATISERYPYLKGNTSFVTQDTTNYFRKAIVWTYLSSSDRAFRLSLGGEIASNASQCAYVSDEKLYVLLAYLNTPIVTSLMRLISPTLNSNLKEFLALPFPNSAAGDHIAKITRRIVQLSQEDWDNQETSLDFVRSPVQHSETHSLRHCFLCWKDQAESAKTQLIGLETEVNREFIKAMQMEGEVEPLSSSDTCVLQSPDPRTSSQFLLAYTIGCMMGRYSLDEPGLVYAHSGNQGFDPTKYRKFSADEDGIIPLTDFDWFADDAANRLEKFVATAWPAEHLEENLKFVAEGLGAKNGESARGTIRRYLSADFFKHHLSMYKKRPIYWLFSSGRQHGFQALVYLHRYNEGTLARMRTEYVIPLLGKMTGRLEHLQGRPEQQGQGGEIGAATSTPIKRKLEKERDTIKKQMAEVQTFDEKLRHYADQRIKLDLDDGVKVNYGKFSDPEYGDILAEVKAVTGGSADE